MSAVVLRANVIAERIAHLKAAWESDPERFANANGLAVVYGKQPQHADAHVNAAHIYFLEFQFPDTLLVLTKDKLFFVTSPKKTTAYLEPLKAELEKGDSKLKGVEVVLLNRKRVSKGAEISPGEEDPGWAAFLEVASAVGGEGATLGVLGSPDEGDSLANDLFVQSWEAAVKKTGLRVVDCAGELRREWERKDAAAVQMVRQAAVLSARTLAKKLQEGMSDALEKEEATTHDAISKAALQVLEDPSSIRVQAAADRCDFWIQPVVQSGGKYSTELSRDLRPDTSTLSPDVVLMAVGGAVQSHYALCARTYLIDPTPAMTSLYKKVLDIHNRVCFQLVPGAVIGEVVRPALEELAKAAPAGTRIPEDLGHAIGFLPHERKLDLKPDSRRKIDAGMVFAVVTRLDEIPRSDKASASSAAVNKLAKYSMLLGDTLAVVSRDEARAAGLAQPNIVCTSRARTDLNNVSFDYADDDEDEEEEDEDEEEEDEEEKPKKRRGKRQKDDDDDEDGELGVLRAEDDEGNLVKRSGRLAAKAAETEGVMDAAMKRAQRQYELLEQLIERRRAEVRRKKAGGETLNEEADAKEREVEAAREMSSYESSAAYPEDAVPTRIMVDRARETVLLPVRGTLLPMHIATIQSLQKSEEGDRHVLRFTFFAPTVGAPPRACTPMMLKAMQKHPVRPYIKTLVFQAKDGTNLANQYRIIRDMQKRMKQRIAEAREQAGAVSQAALMIDRDSRAPRLASVDMWPSLPGRKKCRGNLEAHVNGLRFREERGEVVDLIYSNIKHAIYQPCRSEHVVLLHFHLKQPIMIGKKRHKDVQFYTEAVESSMALDSARRSVYDPDEVDEEARERALRKRLNQVFKDFARKVQARARGPPQETDLEFDAPDESLAFQASTGKEMTSVAPTRDALVALISKPPLVVSTDDIEHVHFERVIVTSRSFDLVLILKPTVDHKEGFIRLQAIPMEKRETIEEWLTDVVEITYTMGTMNIGWGSLVKELHHADFYFSEDEYGQSKPAGWRALIESEDEGDDEDKESEFGVDSDEEEGEEDDEDFDELVDEEDDDEEEFEEEEEDDDEEAADWDELEEKAEADDRARWGGNQTTTLPAGSKRGRSSKDSGNKKRRR